jgi:outer membrane protein OmpA-like peptidoglycan-associated protein
MKGFFVSMFLAVLFSQAARAQDYRYYVLEKMPEFINSQHDEITPVVSRDGRTLFFTRIGSPDFNPTLLIDSVDMAKKLPPEKYRSALASVYSQIAETPIFNPVQTAFNQDVWIAQCDSNGVFQAIQHPGYPLNNALPNSLVSITPDPKAFYVINQFERNGNMGRGFSLVNWTNDSTWSFPKPIEIKDFYTITSDVSLTMSFDGQILILSAVRSDSRDMDLYVCFRAGEHQWSAPQHLGNVVNSPKRETTPFLSEDNETLFFSSNREEGRAGGGNDIFTTQRLDDTWKKWSSPQRVKKPINDETADDSQPYFNTSTGYLYFTSKRGGGNSDIFRVRIAPPQPTELEVFGRVLDKKTKELVGGVKIFYGAAGNPQNVLIASDGTFRLKIPKGVSFQLTPQKIGFNGLPDTVLFRRNYYYFREQYVDLYVEPLSVNAKIELPQIFFQQSKAVILASSLEDLDYLVEVLKSQPTLEIRIEGHTDNNGLPEDLRLLSEERAAAVQGYLIQKGIAIHRIQSIGKGSAFPLNDNSTDTLRAQNRRVEIFVTKI